MKIIEGFEPARLALSRKTPFYESEQERAVLQIINDVRKRGDAALRDYTLKFDGVRLASLEVNKEAVRKARREVDSGLLSALKLAAKRIRSFHIAQRRHMCRSFTVSGAGQLVRPLERVGIYAPGGTAYYPSTVLMTAIPARVAGVEEVILVTPPGPEGKIPAPTLVAADIAKVDRIFSVGGAQAIAALAFGTESIPRVDKICGPGNIFVVLAKKLVYGAVDIDGLQGPSEILIIADDTANPGYCAADLLAQAEHDRLAQTVLVTTSRRLADEVNLEVQRQLKNLPRRTIAGESLEKRGVIAIVAGMDEAIELANLFAPEHLALMAAKADTYIEKLTNAGCIFVGENSTVPLGDYVAGPSHALPTGGSARFSSPLNIADFIKFTSVIDIDESELEELGDTAVTMARAEGLEAHARAVEKRLKGAQS